jgi:hypothetical protein
MERFAIKRPKVARQEMKRETRRRDWKGLALGWRMGTTGDVSKFHITCWPSLFISTNTTGFDSSPLNPPKNICITAYVNHVPKSA